MSSKEVQNLWMVCAQEEARRKQINEVISKCVSFKIGKTGMTLEERVNSPDYANKYNCILQLFESSNPDEVSRMEAHLINTYINLERCDNEKDGVSSIYDEMKDGAEKYYVYIVWR